MLSVATFRRKHAHLVAQRPDIDDLVIQDEIESIYAEFGESFNAEDPAILGENAAGQAICHRLQLQYPPLDCTNPTQHMVGRVTTLQSATDRITTNAKLMANPSDWESTACGGLFRRYIDNSSLGILGICNC
jgi:hypothetical protein